MPKITEDEKEKINEMLMKEGMKLFSTYGLKKVTIDDLTKAAGISHGAFYSFFKNKEELFMSLNIRYQERLFEDIKIIISKHKHYDSKKLMRMVVFALIEGFEKNEILRQIDDDLWTVIERKIPKEMVLENDRIDGLLFQYLVDSGVVFKKDLDIVVHIMQLLFLTISKVVAHDRASEIVEVYVDGIIDQLVE